MRGVTSEILNAQGSATTQITQAEQCLTNGAKVIIALRPRLGHRCDHRGERRQGGRQGDRLRPPVLKGQASYYVSFNNVTVGQLQGQGLVAAMKANGTYAKHGVVAELNGAPTDNNATLFAQGYNCVLNPPVQERPAHQGPEPVRAPTGTTRSR